MAVTEKQQLDKHTALVTEINKMFPNYFKKREKHIFSNEIHTELSKTDISKLAEIVVRLFHFSGSSVGNFDLNELFEAYFLDVKKREEINELLKNIK